ncbi:MAG: PEP-CTERM sorting domain-containing protein [Verrucomicrobiales bacterium]
MKHLTASALLTLLPLTAPAAVIFSGTNGELDFNTATGNFTKGGITVTLTANDGVVNATSNGLGINGSSGSDDTDGLDTLALTEILTVSFDQDVVFEAISIASVGTNDALELSFNGGTPVTLSSTGSHSFNETLLAGQELTITATIPSGSPGPNNGVNITSFTVVPEPGTALLALGAGLCALRRRR